MTSTSNIPEPVFKTRHEFCAELKAISTDTHNSSDRKKLLIGSISHAGNNSFFGPYANDQIDHNDVLIVQLM